ncbi:MAG: hypothetical protein HRT68_04160 [Flavobacteriaceae bacterium]|nr:hypothetical protein [Flavobacteriaceae bacterium]
MTKLIQLFFYLLIVLLLTITTQVGGIIWIIALVISKKFKLKKRFVFPAVYLVFNLIIIPPIANHFGRERLPVFHNHLKPRNWFYQIAFRNYVKPELKEMLLEIVEENQYHPITITYLDASFPFIDGFPLPPHLSHNDGKKVDISFMYTTKDGTTTTKKPSLSGYGHFTEPESYSGTQTERCLNKGHWQYDKAKYLSLGTINDLDFDRKETKRLLKILLKEPRTEKILLEPHLKFSLGLTNYSKIRFHGCRAVRHDDHLHLQIK